MLKKFYFFKSEIQQKMINVLELWCYRWWAIIRVCQSWLFQYLGLIDHDQNCIKTPKKNFSHVPIINEDLNLLLQKITTNKDQLIKNVNILVASLPCPSFAYVGKGGRITRCEMVAVFYFYRNYAGLKTKTIFNRKCKMVIK